MPWITKHIRFVHFIFLIAIFLNVIVLFFALQNKLNAYLAADLIGQTDFSGSIVFTTRNVDNNPPNNKGLNFPYNISEDPINHRLYVVDTQNSRVLAYNLDQNNNLIDNVADFVLGQNNFTSADVNCSPNGFNKANAVLAIPSKNILLVADNGNSRLLVFDTTNLSNGQNATNVLGQPNFYSCTDYVNASQNAVKPGPMAFDPTTNYLYVTNSKFQRVLVFDISAIADNMDAINVLGQQNFTSGNNGLNASSFYSPSGLAIDTEAKRLYVGDIGNNRVLIFDVNEIVNGENAINVLGQPGFVTRGWGTGTQNGLSSPTSVVLDTQRKILFVADANNNRVMIFDVNEIVNGENAINVLGQPGFVTDAKNTSQNGLSYPQGIEIDQTNKLLYVAERYNNRVMIFDTTNIVGGANAINLLGQLNENNQPRWTTNYTNNSPTNNGGFNGIREMTMDKVHHRLFITEGNNNRVLIFNLDNNNRLIDRVADNVLGQPNFSSNVYGATANSMYFPYGLAYDPDRNWLFVTDSGNQRVLIYDIATINNGEDAIFVLGQSNFINNDLHTTQNGLYSPSSLFFNTKNNYLFVADNQNRRVMVFDTTNIANGQNAIYVLGQQTFNTRTAAATASTFDNSPYGLAYDEKNDALFVADYGLADRTGSRVLRFDIKTINNGEPATHVIGQADFTSTNRSGATQNSLYWPRSIAYDENNQTLIVADTNNNRLMFFDVSNISNGENAYNVIGQPNFTSNASAPAANQDNIIGPYGAYYDAQNNLLYAADGGNYRINIYRFVRPTGLYADGVVGLPYQSPAQQSVNSQGNVTYRLYSGNLPPGLAIGANGAIAGIPTIPGTYNFTVQAVDTTETGPFYGTRDYSIVVSNSGVQFQNQALSALESLTNPVILVTLNNAIAQNVSVDYAVTGGTANAGTDYTLSNGTLTIPARATSTTLPLVVINDGQIEPNETIQITLSNPINAELGANSVLTYTIINNDNVQEVLVNQLPVISNVITTSTANSARITWQSADDRGIASTNFTYGLTNNYGISANPVNNLIELFNLNSNTNYYFQISVTDTTGSSTNFAGTVRTLAPPTTPTTTPHVPSPPPDVSNFQANAGTGSFTLTWVNPNVARFLGVRILRKTNARSITTNDGTLVFTGSGTRFLDTHVNANTTYYYTAFSYDAFNDYSPGAFVSARIYREICNNKIDDDQNGLTDCADPTCAGDVRCQPKPVAPTPLPEPTPTPEPTPQPPPTPTPVVTQENCVNSIDDNNNGLIDCADPQCQVACYVAKHYEQVFPTDTATSTPTTSFKLTLPTNILGLTFENDTLTGLTGTKFNLEIPLKSFPSEPQNVVLKIYSKEKIFAFTYDSINKKYITNVELPETGEHTGKLEISYLSGQNFTYQFKIVCLNQGFVVDTNGNGIPDAMIALHKVGEAQIFDTSSFNQTNPASSGTNGSFSFVVPNGEYYLVINKNGYTEKTTAVFTVKNNIINFNVTLNKKSAVIENIKKIAAPIANVTQNSTRAVVRAAQQVGTQFIEAKKAVEEIKQNPEVQIVVSNVIAPSVVGATAAATLPFMAFGDIIGLLQFSFLQPILLLVRRKKGPWGEVYNSLTKLPVDLAIVRLINAQTNKTVQTRVTDHHGRYFFLAEPGNYRLEVIKNGMIFPSSILKDTSSDGHRTNLYLGGNFTITTKDTAVSYVIPLDKLEDKEAINLIKIKWNKFGRKLQMIVALFGMSVSLVSLYFTPRWYVLLLFILHAALFAIFWRLARPHKAKDWGMVFDTISKKPLANAIVRLFDARFNKLVATTATDSQGRYYFLTGESTYFLLCEANKYTPYRSENINFQREGESLVNADIPMKNL